MTDFGMTPVDPADLLAALERRIREKAGLTSDLVFFSLLSDRVHMETPPVGGSSGFVTIHPGRWPVWEEVVAGGGMLLLEPPPDLPNLVGTDPLDDPFADAEAALAATVFGFNATLTLTVFARLSSDQENRSARKIRDASVGAVALALRVAAAVQFWHPITSAPDHDIHAMTREPPRADELSWDSRDVGEQSWATCKIPYSIRFTCKLPSAKTPG